MKPSTKASRLPRAIKAMLTTYFLPVELGGNKILTGGIDYSLTLAEIRARLEYEKTVYPQDKEHLEGILTELTNL